jgi:peptidyl-tRNA hydrolase ICT1
MQALMYRRTCLRSTTGLSQWPQTLCDRSFAAARGPADASDEELRVARGWLAKLHAETIPKSIGELSFSRSSGPGGQNVNKYVLH